MKVLKHFTYIKWMWIAVSGCLQPQPQHHNITQALSFHKCQKITSGAQS